MVGCVRKVTLLGCREQPRGDTAKKGETVGTGAGGPRCLPGVNTSRSWDSVGMQVVLEHFPSWGGNSQPTALDWLLDSLFEVYDFISLGINLESKYLIWRRGVRKNTRACTTCQKVGELLRGVF